MKTNKKADTKNNKSFKNVTLLSPCAVTVILPFLSQPIRQWSIRIRTASECTKKELKNEEIFYAFSHEQATDRILSFLWCYMKGKLKTPMMGFTPNEKIDSWSKKIHEEVLHEK